MSRIADTSMNSAPQEKRRPNRKRWPGRSSLISMAGLAVVLGGWELLVHGTGIPSYVLPSIEDVVRSLADGLLVPVTDRSGYYLPLWSTLSNSAIGYFIGGLLAIVLGSLMAEFRTMEKLLMPYAFALQSLPKVAIAPLIVIWCGFGDSSKIAMAALLTFFPVLVNTFAGIQSTERGRLDLMQSLSASRLETYWNVKLPSAAPYIFAGLEMGIVYALLGTIVAEYLGAQQGIGVTIMQAEAVTDVPTVFAVLVILGAVGVAMHLGISWLKARIIRW
ncbi:ABC transporter permease [Mesorhizobium sp. BE184]|uniref:ABC transporter permease n=1 Tax=Mesorhizobium sp. BE184 TaxID=2817714 RepID=UPI0028643733|nr:ABC transporter permease [Mesorhizobium sp. BE184]MDR7033158.1 NitT/TauT family transport system permease protein [Mesorhizobium sp. BE184]